jgi:hypothetical protein
MDEKEDAPEDKVSTDQKGDDPRLNAHDDTEYDGNYRDDEVRDRYVSDTGQSDCIHGHTPYYLLALSL